MKRLSVAVCACALAISAGLATVGTATAGAQNDANKATDVGVTATEIRIAVVADVDNPFAPGLFQGAVDAVNGAAKYINANGGIGGRKVKVDFIDSHLNANEARNAIITACQQDFALVGTEALFLSNMDDAINCKDINGAGHRSPRPRRHRDRHPRDVRAGDVHAHRSAAAVRHQGPAPADVPGQPGRLHLLQEEQVARTSTARSCCPTTRQDANRGDAVQQAICGAERRQGPPVGDRVRS